jgi:hypothetical protein
MSAAPIAMEILWTRIFAELRGFAFAQCSRTEIRLLFTHLYATAANHNTAGLIQQGEVPQSVAGPVAWL